jgi:glycosyltransferase involved in cell wall biosynthesis
MAALRVLITTYHQAFLAPGGGEAELVDMAADLRALGVAADIYGHASQPLSYYDVVLHFSAHGGGEPVLEQVKAAGKPIVLLPNLALNRVSDANRQVIDRHLSLADVVVFRAECDRAAAIQMFGLNPDRVRTVPQAVAPCFGVTADPHIFPVVYTGEREYVLWVGMIEESKNQLGAIRALRDLDLPVVFVGTYRDKAYYDACRAEAPDHFIFVPHLTPKSEALRSAYQYCRLYLEASMEPPGMSALEAGLAGAPLVLTDCAWSREYFGDAATLVDPASADSIRDGVAAGLRAGRSAALADGIRTRYGAPGALATLVDLMTGLRKTA